MVEAFARVRFCSGVHEGEGICDCVGVDGCVHVYRGGLSLDVWQLCFARWTEHEVLQL